MKLALCPDGFFPDTSVAMVAISPPLMTKSLRIAVADDEPDMQEYFRRALPRLGHQVVSVAGNGDELVRHCREMQPDLIITDVTMDGKDGIAAVEEVIRERPVPVILVTAYQDPEKIARAGSTTIQAYLVKPIKQGDFGPAIEQALERFRALHLEDN